MGYRINQGIEIKSWQVGIFSFNKNNVGGVIPKEKNCLIRRRMSQIEHSAGKGLKFNKFYNNYYSRGGKQTIFKSVDLRTILTYHER